MGRRLNRHCTKEDAQIANQYIKRCSTSLVITEIEIKVNQDTKDLLRWLKFKITIILSFNKDME